MPSVALHVVVGLKVDIRAVGHRPVLVRAQEEVLARLAEEAALDALAARDAGAERGQQRLLPVLLDDDCWRRRRKTSCRVSSASVR